MIQGIYPALITPFEKDGALDLVRLKEYTERLYPRVDGLFVCGSYGSGPLMSVTERQHVAESIANVIGGDGNWILHVGASNLPEVLELLEHANDLTPSAVAVVTPYYYRHSDSEVERFFKAIIDAARVPVLLYNNPKYTNYAATSQLIRSLADYGLAGVKDSSGNIAFFYELLDAVAQNEGFTSLIGSQTLLLPALLMGANGCVSGLSNAFPELVAGVYEAWTKGDRQQATQSQRSANQLRRLTGEGIPVPFYHAVLPMLGLDIGSPRSPFVPLTDERTRTIREELLRLGLIP